VRLAGLILLFAEKLLLSQRRAQSNRYPDFGLKPHSAFPLPVALEFVAVTVAQPLRILTGFPDIRLHRWRNFFRRFKERSCFTLNQFFFKTNCRSRGDEALINF